MYIQKQNNWRKKNDFVLGHEGHWWKKQDPEPDPSVRGTEPRIRIRTKMSRIRNTAY